MKLTLTKAKANYAYAVMMLQFAEDNKNRFEQGKIPDLVDDKTVYLQLAKMRQKRDTAACVLVKTYSEKIKTGEMPLDVEYEIVSSEDRLAVMYKIFKDES